MSPAHKQMHTELSPGKTHVNFIPTYNPKTIDRQQDDSFIGELLTNWKPLWERSNWMYFIIQKRFKLWKWPCWCADHLIIDGKGRWRVIHVSFMWISKCPIIYSWAKICLVWVCSKFVPPITGIYVTLMPSPGMGAKFFFSFRILVRHHCTHRKQLCAIAN